MTPQQIIHATFRAGRKLALLVFALLLLVALLDLFGIAPAFLMPLTAHLGTWLALCAFVAALFWGVAFAIDPYRTGPVPVDALFAKAQRKLKWHRRLSRAEKLCYDALTLYQPISDHGLAQAIPILGPERARAALYVLHETHLEKAHFTLEKALTLYDDDPEGFAAQSADLDKMLDEAAFQQLPGRLKTRLEEIMRRH